MKNLRKYISILLTLVLLMAVPVNAVDADALPVFHTVAFDTDGGSEINAQKVLHGDCVIRPDDPVREGYLFLGWHVERYLSERYDFSTPVTSDLTLCADWEEVSLDVTISEDTSPDNEVRRNITGVVESNSPLSSVKYTLKSENKAEEGYLTPDNNGAFAFDVLLEGGLNTVTVTASTPDGSEASDSVELTYDSGYVFSMDDTRLFLKPVWFENTSEEPSEPDAFLVANVLDIFFSDDSSFGDRQDFIENTLGGKMVGYLNSLDMMEVLFTESRLPDAGLSYTGETNLADITEDELREYAAAIASAYGMVNSVGLEHIYNFDIAETTSNDDWDGDKTNDWWLDMIEAYDAWDYDDSCNRDFLTDTTVGVVDSGFQDDHEDLEGRITILSAEDTPHYHGTHVAGIMAASADNGKGAAGIMHNNASLAAYDAQGASYSNAEIQEGLTKTVEAGAKVINFSMGLSDHFTGYNIDDAKDTIKTAGETYSKAMGILLEKGSDFVVVNSTGNGNKYDEGIDYVYNGVFCSVTSENCYESSKVTKEDIMKRIIVVSALYGSAEPDQATALTAWSNGYPSEGTGELCVIAAPGDEIFSTVCEDTKSGWKDNEYKHLSGTSMATPMVTAVCALSWSANPSLTGIEVRDLVEHNCSDETAAKNTKTWGAGDKYYSRAEGGMPILNAKRAVEAAVKTRPEIYGYIVGKKTDAPVPAQIEIHKGTAADGELVGDLISGTEIYQFVADASGKVTLPRLPSGKYTLVVSAKGYYNCEKTITVVDGGVLINAVNIAEDFGKILLTSVPVVEFETNGGSHVSSQVVDYGYTAAKPADPVKTGYDFGGWYTDESFTNPFDFSAPITEDITLYAKWIPKEFTVTWVIDGKEEKETCQYGTTPSHVDPTKEGDAKYSYIFKKWEPAIVEVTGDATYTAVFDQTINSYTVTWVINGKEEKETYEYGTTPSHADPVKEADAQYTYTFKEWTPAIETVTGDATYTAVFDSTVNHYSVTWVIDGSAQTEDYAYGDMPWHPAPSKSGALGVYYVFKGWTPTVVPVTGNAVYTAVFNAQINPLFPGIQKPSGVNTSVPDKEPELPSFVSDHEPAVLPFTDVTTASRYYDDIRFVYDKDIMIGMSDKTFGENIPLTRAMVVTVLWRMDGEVQVNTFGTFTDVPAGEWYSDAVEWAASHGIVLGYGDGRFGPDDNVTREQLAAILFRYANWKGYDTSVGENTNILSYNDAFTWGDWAVSALQWACGAGVLEDVPVGMLRPTEAATRGEIAHAIRVFCEEVAS